MALPLVDDHRKLLSLFQTGEDRFVWGRDRRTGSLWFLPEDTATEHRPFVQASIGCPVPGCDVSLTAAHYRNKRDHLRHLSGKGGHARESILHSQGCAIIEDWLRRAYPLSRVMREEYTNEAGERRADVLLTSPQGHRIAFEVQFSPISVESWTKRHESYERQGIRDVWLFGNTDKQLRLDVDGHVLATATHYEVVARGAALMFIKPDADSPSIGYAVGSDFRFDGSAGAYSGEPVDVVSSLPRAQLQLEPLDLFRASNKFGMTSDLLTHLHERGQALKVDNERERDRHQAKLRRTEQEKEAKRRTWEAKRQRDVARIRDLLGEVESWPESPAHASILRYFTTFLRGRIEWHAGALEHWQCVIYFDLIASADAPFGISEADKALRRRGANIGVSYRLIGRYLHALRDLDYLDRVDNIEDRYPRFVATTSGAWW